MDIAESARKHGIEDADILHALRLPLRHISEHDCVLVIGPARDGRPLEIVVLDPESDEPVVIHAMDLREKFRRLL